MISLRQFSRNKKVNLYAVQSAIKAGRLSKALVRNANGHIKLDEEIANEEWEMKDVAKVRNEKDMPAGDDKSKNSNFTNARTVKATFEAKLAQLEYERKIGRYCLVDEVKTAAFKSHRTIRDNVLNVPDRIFTQLAAELDPHKVHKMLMEELLEALNRTGETWGFKTNGK